MPSLENRLKRCENMLCMSEDFEIIRNDQVTSMVQGFFCNANHPNMIQFLGNVDVQVGDSFRYVSQGHKGVITQTTPITSTVGVTDWLVKYQPKLD